MAASSQEKVTLAKGEKKEVILNYHTLRKAVLTLRSINHKLRKNIIKLLEKNDKLTVTKIYVKLKIEQSVASQHLALLRKAGVVNTKRDGKFMYYSLNEKRLVEIAGLVDNLSEN